MTVSNKKTNPAKYDKNRHFGASDTIAVGKEGTVCGQVGQEGNLYLLRTKENPHVAQWVTFGNSTKS